VTDDEGIGIGARFVRAIESKDVPGLLALLAPDVDFRGLTPSQAWRASTPEEVSEIVFGSWFEPDDEIREVLELDDEPFADRHRIRYRLLVETDGEPFLVEQQGYFDAADDRITRISLACSGYRSLPSV
jgi:ketosteroid isomerase-like protein